MMNSLPLAVYALSVVSLVGKFVVLVSIQARERLGSRAFRHPEDAAAWNGSVGAESELCIRAQHTLRNSGEGEPLFLALGAVYLALGCWPAGAVVYFLGYTASRLVHAGLMLRPRQPQRTVVFGLGLAALLAMAVHVVFTVCSVGSGAAVEVR